MDNKGLKQEWYNQRSLLLRNDDVDFKMEEHRLRSFIDIWPSYAQLSPGELAAAGFYYTGPDDRVQCAWCRGGLYNWEAGDIAISEHKKHFPKCPFVEKKLNDMIGITKRPHPKGGSSGTTKLSLAIQIVEQMGYNADITDKALRKLKLASGSITSCVLLDAIHELEDEQNVLEIRPHWPPSPSCNKNEDNTFDGRSLATETSPKGLQSITETECQSDPMVSKINNQQPINTVSVLSQEEIVTLQEENKRLKNSKICKICFDSDVNLLFLPCRHLACCEQCGESVKNCPMCRNDIVATVKAFLS